MHAIEARSLSKYFGENSAIDNMSFAVETGEIFGFLGSNGAGKSTTMMILTTLLKPTSGHALVAGHDVVTSPIKVRQSMGYVQQETTADEYLTGRENMTLQARLNHIPKDQTASKIDEILELVELADRQDEPVLEYSGGMRKRLDIAGGLLHRPKVLFLDEPTVGLDIHTRKRIWEYIKKIHNEFGMSVFLTTHYMEEADNLCDRIGIIDHGKIQAIDSPRNMKMSIGSEVITLGLESTPTEQFLAKIRQVAHIRSGDSNSFEISLFTSDGAKVLPQIFHVAANMDVNIVSVSMTQPTLDEAFMSYTGRNISDGHDKVENRRTRTMGL